MAYRTRNKISEARFLWFMALKTYRTEAKKLSAGISISLGWPVTRSMGDMYAVCLVNFSQIFDLLIIMDLNGTWTLMMVTGHEDPSALVIFWVFFLGSGRFFRWVLQRTTRLNVQRVELSSVECCGWKMLDLQAWKVTQIKSSHFTKKHMEEAPFCIDRSTVLAILS